MSSARRRPSWANAVAAAPLLVACGARSPLRPGPEADANDAASDPAAADAASPAPAPSGDASPPRGGPDPGPQSCADVGKYPGLSSCCEGRYCAGDCRDFGRSSHCYCGMVSWPCVFPEVCCNGMCTNPAHCAPKAR